jgi:hypothetical protein
VYWLAAEFPGGTSAAAEAMPGQAQSAAAARTAGKVRDFFTTLHTVRRAES